MDITRRNFFKKAGLLAGAAVFAPKILVEAKPKPEAKPDGWKILYTDGTSKRLPLPTWRKINAGVTPSQDVIDLLQDGKSWV